MAQSLYTFVHAPCSQSSCERLGKATPTCSLARDKISRLSQAYARKSIRTSFIQGKRHAVEVAVSSSFVRKCAFTVLQHRVARSVAHERNQPYMTGVLGGGLLGVGPMEVVVVLAVGWLVLGPSELLNVTKQAGRFVGSLRGKFEDIRKSVTSIIDNDNLVEQLQSTMKSITEPVEAIQSEARGFQDQLRRMNDPKQRSPYEAPRDSKSQFEESKDSEGTNRAAEDLSPELPELESGLSAVLKNGVSPLLDEEGLKPGKEIKTSSKSLFEDVSDLETLEAKYRERRKQILGEGR